MWYVKPTPFRIWAGETNVYVKISTIQGPRRDTLEYHSFLKRPQKLVPWTYESTIYSEHLKAQPRPLLNQGRPTAAEQLQLRGMGGKLLKISEQLKDVAPHPSHELAQKRRRARPPAGAPFRRWRLWRLVH